MSALIIFKKTGKLWKESNGSFEILFSGIYDRYINKTLTPEFCKQIIRNIGPSLYHYWPDRYPQQDWNDDHVLSTEYYSLSELSGLLRASEAFVTDFVAGRADKALDWGSQWKSRLDQSYTEFVILLREEVTAREKAGAMDGIE